MSDREQLVRLVDSLLDTYRPEGVVIWLTSGNRNFGGYSPRDYIRDGDWQPLLDEAERLAGGPPTTPRPHPHGGGGTDRQEQRKAGSDE